MRAASGLQTTLLGGIALAVLVSVSTTDSSTMQALEREVAEVLSSVAPHVVTVRATFAEPVVGTAGGNVVNIGSGLLVDSLGYVITAGGVVTHFAGVAAYVMVLDHEKHPHEALLYTVDPRLRIAVLYVPTLAGAAPLPVRADPWYRGALALVVGNSFGVGPSASLTTVAGQRERDGFWQLNDPATPGYSGAPVFDSAGELGGIIIGEVAGDEGDPYERPLPALMVTSRELAPLISGLGFLAAGRGKPWLGIAVRPVVDPGGRISLFVSTVFSNSPAAQAGILPGDVLVSVDTLTVSYVADLADWIRRCRPGHEAAVHVLRGGERRTVTVTVGTR